jgi:curved DNA-binding protein CbpA
MADHYATLGVAFEADRTAIQAAYRRLARLHHPDFGGDPTVMSALNEAWSVLGNPQQRSTYDAARRLRRAAVAETSGGRPEATAPPAATGPITAAGERRAGSPPDPASTVTFGRYTGWTIAQLAVHDPDYLEWLARAPIGRTYRQEIYLQLARRPPPRTTYTNVGGTATIERPHALRARLGLHRRR